MRMRGWLFAPAVAAALCTAPAAAEIPKSQAEELVAVTGLEAQVRSIPDSLKQSLRRGQQNQQVLSRAEVEKVEDILDQAASPDELLDWVVAEVAGQLDSRHLEPLLSWFRSELGTGIVERERELADPEAAAEIVRRADELLADDQARQRAERVEDIGLGVDFFISVFEKSQLALTAAVVEAKKPEGTVKLATLEERLDSRADQVRDPMRQATLAGYAHVYGPLSQAEFKDFTEFAASDAAQHYYDVVREAYAAALTRYSDRVAEQSAAVEQQ